MPRLKKYKVGDYVYYSNRFSSRALYIIREEFTQHNRQTIYLEDALNSDKHAVVFNTNSFRLRLASASEILYYKLVN